MQSRFRSPAIPVLAVLVLLAMALAPAGAAAADWTIARISGDVRVHRNGASPSAEWVSLRPGLNPNHALAPGDAIWTGRNGRVMLAAADGRIIVSPRSMVMIPAQDLPGNLTVIFHGFGTVEAAVEKRRRHHFSVQSIYMAAVVKGTRFTVSGDDAATRLDVAEGLVQAIDLATGRATDVPAGRFLVIAGNRRAGPGGTNAGGGTTVTGGVSTGSPPAGGLGAPAGNGKGNKGNGRGNGGGNGTGNEGNGNGPGGNSGGGNGNGNGGGNGNGRN